MVESYTEERLRLAEPLLVTRVVHRGGLAYYLSTFLREKYVGWDELLDEGYDPIHSPLGCPVYWRIVVRGPERLYLSTFVLEREKILECWGPGALRHVDLFTGTGFARIETLLTAQEN